jgi:hypothetical protein
MLTVSRDDRSAFRRLCDRVSDWQAFFDHAEIHGVAGLLYQALRKSGYEVPGEEAVALERRDAAGRLVRRHQYQELSLILTTLENADFRPVVLKGPVLAERLYGDPLLRFWSDLDLLVSPQEVDPVSRSLESLGFQQVGGPKGSHERSQARHRTTRHLTFCHAELPTVDLHFQFLVGFGVTVPAEDFLQRAVRYQTLGGATCQVLGPEDELLYLCLHAAHHQFTRFCWLLDIWTLLRLQQGLDWEAVFHRAELARVRAAAFYSVELLGRRLGITAPLPSPSSSRLTRQGIASTVLRIYSEITPEDTPHTLTRPNIGFVFKACLCDRLPSVFPFLGENLVRFTRRRLGRRLPWLVPKEWSR